MWRTEFNIIKMRNWKKQKLADSFIPSEFRSPTVELCGNTTACGLLMLNLQIMWLHQLINMCKIGLICKMYIKNFTKLFIINNTKSAWKSLGYYEVARTCIHRQFVLMSFSHHGFWIYVLFQPTMVADSLFPGAFAWNVSIQSGIFAADLLSSWKMRPCNGNADSLKLR